MFKKRTMGILLLRLTISESIEHIDDCVLENNVGSVKKTIKDK